jgi:hypothetical protein
MKRSSLVVLGLVSAVAGACAARRPAAGPVLYRAGLKPGEYACSIYGGIQYPEYPCQVTLVSSGEADGEMWLEKLAGEVRYAGRLVPAGLGYHFEGERFCPGDECSETIAMDLLPGAVGFFADGTDADGPFRFSMRYVGEVGTMGWGGGVYGYAESSDEDYYGYDDDYYGGDYYGGDYYGGGYYGGGTYGVATPDGY